MLKLTLFVYNILLFQFKKYVLLWDLEDCCEACRFLGFRLGSRCVEAARERKKSEYGSAYSFEITTFMDFSGSPWISNPRAASSRGRVWVMRTSLLTLPSAIRRRASSVSSG
jgi:hypothetical protein